MIFAVRMSMQVTRDGGTFHGSLTRDDLRLPFSGILELIAALEQLTPDETANTGDAPPRREPGGAR